VRALVEPERLVTEVLKIAADPYARPAVKLAAIDWLACRGWGKSVESREIDVFIQTALSAGDVPPAPVELMNDAELAEAESLVARVEQRLLTDGSDVQDAEWTETALTPETLGHDAFCADIGCTDLCSVPRKEIFP
jgi:hypothetical protein